ncbi:MAG: heparinase II/III family protein [Myxococcaceae bacterium]
MGSLSHYTRLARGLGPAELAWAVVRRARRSARKALHRPRGWDPDKLSSALGLAPAEAAEALLCGASSPAWCEPSRRIPVLAALDRVPGARDRAIAQARALAARSFELFGTRVRFGAGEGIDWALSRRRYPLGGGPGAGSAGADPKYRWALGRLDGLVSLARGSWAVGSASAREALVEELAAQAQDFLRANPPGQGVQWECPMEVSLRAGNLAQALSMVRDAKVVRDPGFALPLLAALAEHCEHVEAHLEDDGAVPNNHLVADYVGLLVVGALFPLLPGAPRWTALSAGGLRRQIDAQVHPDGCSFEGSVSYHRLSTELFTLALLSARAGGVPLGTAYLDRLRRMYRVAAAYCSEQGLAPQIGDNDSGRVFPPCARRSLDHGYLAPLGAALFGEGALKRPGEKLPEEAAWLLGIEGLRRFERLPAGWRPRTFASPAGGLHVLRGAGATVTVSAGAPGQKGVGGHSHNDRLSFELHLHGAPVIVDPGTGAYAGQRGLRDRLRGTASHNTVQVDGREQAPLDPERPFALPGPACEVRARQAGPFADRLVARYLAHGVEVERTLVLEKKQGLLAVSDRLDGRGVHQLSLGLHLPGTAVRLRAPQAAELRRARACCDAFGEPGPLAAELGRPGRPDAVVLFAEGVSLSVEPSLYSPGYGELKPARAVFARTRVPLPAALAFVVLFGTSRAGAES